MYLHSTSEVILHASIFGCKVWMYVSLIMEKLLQTFLRPGYIQKNLLHVLQNIYAQTNSTAPKFLRNIHFSWYHAHHLVLNPKNCNTLFLW